MDILDNTWFLSAPSRLLVFSSAFLSYYQEFASYLLVYPRPFNIARECNIRGSRTYEKIASLLVIHKPAEKKHKPSLGVSIHIEEKNQWDKCCSFIIIIDCHDEIDASIRKAKSSDKFEEQSVPLHHPINALHFSVYISILDIHCEDTIWQNDPRLLTAGENLRVSITLLVGF